MSFDPGIVGSLGTLAFIGTTATNAETDTYIIINFIRDISPYGRNYSIVNFTNLSDGAVQKFKGEFNDGDVKITVGWDIADPGQFAFNNAVNYTGPLYYNLKVVNDDASGITGSEGTTDYMKVRATQFTKNINNTQQVILGEMTASIKSGSIISIPAT